MTAFASTRGSTFAADKSHSGMRLLTDIFLLQTPCESLARWMAQITRVSLLLNLAGRSVPLLCFWRRIPRSYGIVDVASNLSHAAHPPFWPDCLRLVRE